MPTYNHECPEHGEVQIDCRMLDAKEIMPCPVCGKDSKRIYGVSGIQWKCDGAFGKSNTSNKY